MALVATARTPTTSSLRYSSAMRARTAQVALHGLFADDAAAEDAFAQAGDFAIGGQDAGRLPGHDFRGLHADGVAADIDGCVAGHPTMLIET